MNPNMDADGEKRAGHASVGPGTAIVGSGEQEQGLLDALFRSASDAYRTGRYPDAEAICRKLIAAEPTEWRGNHLLSLIFSRQGQWDESLKWMKQAAECQPRSREIYNELGSIYNAMGDYSSAISSFEHAIQIDPDYSDACFNAGNACFRMRQHDKAIVFYARALKINPRDHEAWSNLGKAFKALNRLDEAIGAYDQALHIQPGYAIAHWNRAITLLMAEQFSEGFAEYEWRWRLNIPIFTPRIFSQPRWKGEPISGNTLLIHSEQGLGDCIQFVRFIQHVRPMAAKVILECPPSLKSLFEFSGCADIVVSLGEPLPPFDTYIPLMSLPHILHTTLSTIPSQTPYLDASPCAILPPVPSGHLKVGLTWAGNSSRDEDKTRSMRLADMTPLLKLPGITFFGLQMPVSPQDQLFFREYSNFTDLSGCLKDFQHTAALIKQMDLVISVDTSVAHLAGALGKKAWTFLQFSPDWRWFLNRSSSPWYPSMLLFRQPEPDRWLEPIMLAVQELNRL